MPRRVAAVLAALFLAACSNVAYYGQAIGGHLALRQAIRPLQQVLDDPATDPDLRTRLVAARAIREFASRELALPDNGSYRAYADLGRPYVVWNVFAAPELSVEAEQWCMLVVGCVNYRGYYAQQDAEAFAAELRQRGFDTHVAGIPAYSTLGYFDDPLLNTFLRFDAIEVARLIFHELAHQQVFVSDDTVFNESFASAVEDEGVRRWLAQHGSAELQRAFATRQARKRQIAELVARHRERLAEAFAAPLADAAKRQAKAAAIAALRRDYAELKAAWGGYAGYDAWFGDGLNNARIASLALYTQQVPAFAALLAGEENDLPRFYRRVAALARLGKAERQAYLQALPPGDTAATLVQR